MLLSTWSGAKSQVTGHVRVYAPFKPIMSGWRPGMPSTATRPMPRWSATWLRCSSSSCWLIWMPHSKRWRPPCVLRLSRIADGSAEGIVVRVGHRCSAVEVERSTDERP